MKKLASGDEYAEQVPQSPKVRDLLQELEDSIKAAKAARANRDEK